MADKPKKRTWTDAEIRKHNAKFGIKEPRELTPWPEAIKGGFNKTVSDVKSLGRKITKPFRQVGKKASGIGGKYKQAIKEGNVLRTVTGDLSRSPDLIKARQNITKAGGAKPYLGRRK